MSDNERAYDYTEGATAGEIEQVVSERWARRPRRDSQVGSAYDDDGQGAAAVFGGPSASVVPTSVSTMHYDRPWATRRRNSDAYSKTSRRRSGDSQRSTSNHSRHNQSDTDSVVMEDDNDGLSDVDPTAATYSRKPISMPASRARTRRRSGRAPSPESPTQTRGVFENLANLFAPARPVDPVPRNSRRGSLSSRRSSLAGSRRSSRDDVSDGEERWGYSSGEESESVKDGEVGILNEGQSFEFGSRPPSPTPSLPLLNMHADPFFGDTRIDIDITSRPASPPPPPGPPSRQSVVLPDEDMTIRLIGAEINPLKQTAWSVGCIITFGALALISHWSPRLWLRHVTREKAFEALSNGLVVCEVG